MIYFIPNTDIAIAEAMSTALWQLSRPSTVRQVNDTLYMFKSLILPNGSAWLLFDTEYNLPIHIDADPSPIGVILEPFITLGVITELELLNIFDLVEENKGTTLNLWSAIPLYWKNLAKTKEQFIELGMWFVI